MLRRSRLWRSPPVAKPSFRAPSGSTPRSSGVANPYLKFDRVKHWHMWLMVFCCGGAGYAAGKWAPIDDEKLPKALFDKAAIETQMLRTFEFRPDLAATMLRSAFVLAARRAQSASVEIEESCSVGTGLVDVANVFEFQTMANQMSTEDLAALAAVTALRFLRGPHDLIEFRWGREDQVRSRVTPVGSDATTSASKPAVCKHRSLKAILSSVGPLTDEEMVALMACHAVGEYHEDVSGVADAPSRTLTPFTLGTAYFKTLLANEARWQRWEVPRTAENKAVACLPKEMLRCTVAVPLSSANATGAAAAGRAPRSRALIVTKREVDELLNTPSWRKHVERFAADEEAWRVAFASGFTKMIETNFQKVLRRYGVGVEPRSALAAAELEKQASSTSS